MTVAVGLVFGPGQTWPTSFLLFPLLVWASWRFSPPWWPPSSWDCPSPSRS
ncbi:hypothetical protein [Nocardioides zeae]